MPTRPNPLTATEPQSFQRRMTTEVGDVLHSSRWEGVIAATQLNEAKRATLCVEGGRNRGFLQSLTGAIGHGGGGANIAVVGKNLIPAGWRQARVTATQTVDPDSTIIWEAICPGERANGITVEYVQNAGHAVDWVAATRTIHVHCDLAGAATTAATLVGDLAASATGAQYVVQARYPGAGAGAGHVQTAFSGVLAGGTGVELLEGCYTRAEAANKDLEFIRRDVGVDAKPVYVALVHDAALTTEPTIAVVEGATSCVITCTAVVGTDTANDILQAFRDSEDAMEWIAVRRAYGNNGTGLPAAFAATLVPDAHVTSWDSLATGGQANLYGVPASCGDLIVPNVQSLTDDGLTFDIAAGAGAAGTTVMLRFRICGVVYEIPSVTAA
jgi:hypothetical protein